MLGLKVQGLVSGLCWEWGMGLRDHDWDCIEGLLPHSYQGLVVQTHLKIALGGIPNPRARTVAPHLFELA